VIHTGDISHLSKPSEFNTVDQILKSIKTSQIFCVPGEHDGFGENFTSSDTEKEQMASVGTVSIKMAFTSSGWLTCLT
jgi:metallophosphoesterase superfamily enzyme